MKFSRPDVTCNASRFQGPRDHGLSKAKWMTIFNEDETRAINKVKSSVSLGKFAQIGHGTWSHMTLGDPKGSYCIDKALLGEAEAYRRHNAKAERSGMLWQHPDAMKAAPSPTASQVVEGPLPMSEPPRRQLAPVYSNREAEQPPSPIADPLATSTRESARPPAIAFDQPSQFSDRRRQGPPQLPQLWMAQPRSLTPNEPFEASARTGSALATPTNPDRRSPLDFPTTIADRLTRSQIASAANRLADSSQSQSLRTPLRRMESDPGPIKKGYINPALRLRPSPPGETKGGERYGTTYTFG